MDKDSDDQSESTAIKTGLDESGTKADKTDSIDAQDSKESKSAEVNKQLFIPKKYTPSRKFSLNESPKRKLFGRPSRYSLGLSSSHWSWKLHKGLLYGSTLQDKSSSKIAFFDMDGTLITNKRGRRVSDWEFFDPVVPEKLKELKNNGFRIVIASNQQGISLGLVSDKDLQLKIEAFIKAIGVEATAMLATKKDKFKKPETGMWLYLQNTLNNCPIDMAQSVSFF